MTILKTGQFRLATISKLILDNDHPNAIDLALKEGIAIEKNNSAFEECYCVIGFVKYNKHNRRAGLEDDNGGRLLDIDTADWTVFKELYKTAKQLVETANLEAK